ncbi:hypothetical protein [Nostoc sp. PA-18-2419]|nr:hypothetical protein [Nostoc sp. PA-18-2419]
MSHLNHSYYFSFLGWRIRDWEESTSDAYGGKLRNDVHSVRE